MKKVISVSSIRIIVYFSLVIFIISCSKISEDQPYKAPVSGSTSQEAIEYFDRAIELNPKNAEAYNNRGIVYYNLGNLQQAIKDYDKAIELNPKFAMAYHNRGVAYGKLGSNYQAGNDYILAARLGYKGAQDYLTEQGIDW